MKIMLDTNVLFSALLFPSSKPAKVLDIVAEKHSLVLCDHIKAELHNVMARKRPHLLNALEMLLNTIPYEVAHSDRLTSVVISDPNDQPILNAAISGDIDILVTGDKHFLSLIISRPKILTPAEFLTSVSI